MKHETWLVISLTLSFGVLACGEDAPVDANASSHGGGGSTSEGRGGGNGSGGDATSAAGGSAPDGIDPIALGHAWTYDVTELGTFPLCPSGASTAETVDALELDGKAAFEVESLCSGFPSTFYAVTGDLVEVYYQGTWLLALDTPVEQGHTWSNGTSTFTWQDEGSVEVPAGTFDDCWRAVQNVEYEAWTIFCRGAGPVHWYSEDLAGNGFEAVLTAKSF